MGHGAYLKAKEQELKATPEEVRSVEWALSQVEAVLHRRDIPLSIAERYRAGSFSKSVMLRGRQEADYVLALNHFPVENPLGTLEGYLRKHLSGTRMTPRRKALEVTFPDGTSVDVLPIATPEHTSNYGQVPAVYRRGVDGRQHTDWFIRHAHGTVIHPTVVLLKGIRNSHGARERLSSFGLELLAVDVLKERNLGLEPALRAVLDALSGDASRIRNLRDPAYTSNRPLEGLTDADLSAISRIAKSCLEALDRGQPSSLFVAGIPATARNLGGRPLG